MSKLEEVASNESFNVKKKDGTVTLQSIKERRKGQLAIYAETFRDYTFFSCGGSDKKIRGQSKLIRA